MTDLTTVYATDEDIALRASADYALLCPKDQKSAAGIDGAFGSADPWTLTSSSVNFGAQGVSAGQIAVLTRPAANFRSPGEAFVVSSVNSGSISLRRKGQPAGTGQPPGASGGLLGVEFAILTLGPQIRSACYDLNRRFGIDDLVVGRRSADLYDSREIRQATVLTVLYRQYLDMSREAGDQTDVFAMKAVRLKAELDDLLGRVVVRWGPPNSASGTAQANLPYWNVIPPTSRFSTRLTR